MKAILLFSILFSATFLIAQTVGINSTGAVPSTSAMLDVSANDKGLLIPRVNIIDLNTDVPVTSPVTSLLVYNTHVASGVGYYFWNGSKWVNLKDSDSNADEDWYEVGTTTAPDDINDDVFTMGKVGIGVLVPNAPLEISSTEFTHLILNRDHINADPCIEFQGEGNQTWRLIGGNLSENAFKIRNSLDSEVFRIVEEGNVFIWAKKNI